MEAVRSELRAASPVSHSTFRYLCSEVEDCRGDISELQEYSEEVYQFESFESEAFTVASERLTTAENGAEKREAYFERRIAELTPSTLPTLRLMPFIFGVPLILVEATTASLESPKRVGITRSGWTNIIGSVTSHAPKIRAARRRPTTSREYGRTAAARDAAGERCVL